MSEVDVMLSHLSYSVIVSLLHLADGQLVFLLHQSYRLLEVGVLLLHPVCVCVICIYAKHTMSKC